MINKYSNTKQDDTDGSITNQEMLHASEFNDFVNSHNALVGSIYADNLSGIYATRPSANTIQLKGVNTVVNDTAAISNIDIGPLLSKPALYNIITIQPVTINNSAGGSGQIHLKKQANYTTAANEGLLLFFNGTDFYEFSNSSIVYSNTHPINQDDYLAYGGQNQVSAYELRTMLDTTFVDSAELFADIAAIRAITDHSNGQLIKDVSTGIIYRFNSTSTATDDGTTIIRPTDIATNDPGRFLIVSKTAMSNNNENVTGLWTFQKDIRLKDQGAPPSAPPAGNVDLYSYAGKLYFVLPSGTRVEITDQYAAIAHTHGQLHTHNTDTILDQGGTNEISAATLKTLDTNAARKNTTNTFAEINTFDKENKLKSLASIATPASGYWHFGMKSDGAYIKDSSGNEFKLQVSNNVIWWQISQISATPPTDSTITTTSDLTGSVPIGSGVRFKSSTGSWRYSKITNVTSNTITIHGNPLTTGTGDLTELWFCDGRNIEMVVIAGTDKSLLSTSPANILVDSTSGNFHPICWQKQAAALVDVIGNANGTWSSAGPAFNVKFGNNGNALTSNLTLTNPNTDYNAGVTISLTNNAIAHGDQIKLICTTANSLAKELEVTLVILMK
jgi:hypothetical protein